MAPARASGILWIIPYALILLLFSPFVSGKVICVDDDNPADFDSVQAGIMAAEYGDTVSVAPGTYYGNITLKEGVDLLGAGAEVTILDAQGYGDVVDARANNATISGFTLRNSGEFDAGHMNCGVYVVGSYSPVVSSNAIVNNSIGMGLWDGAHPEIRNNIISNNSDGFYIYGREDGPSNPWITNNTIVNNRTNGITLRVMVSPVVVNNIIVGHITGINHNYVTGSPTLSYNNLWDNDVNYLRDNRVDETLAGPGSTSVDPCFAESGHWADIADPNVAVEPNDPNAVWVEGDYHLKSQTGRYDPGTQTWVVDEISSPCIDAGDPNIPVAFEPYPNGGIINMGAYGGTAEASKSPSGLHAPYGGGTGEPDDPYLVYTAEQLNTIGAEPNDWDKHFKLMADIDLSGYSYDRAVIAPDMNGVKAGFQGTPFTGILDGNGYTISNFTCNSNDTDYTGPFGTGFFGHIDGENAEVRNLGLLNPNISARTKSKVGSLVGYISGGTISRCHAENSDISGGGDVGGLVGANYGGTVANCYSTGSVRAEDSFGPVGGLVGRNGSSGTRPYGKVSNSCSTCTVRGDDKVGGLVGWNQRTGQVSNCCSTGTVTGNKDVGGLVGWNQFSGEIVNCYALGFTTGTQNVGGLVGRNHYRSPAAGKIHNCYSAGQVIGIKYVGGLIGHNYRDVDFSFWDIKASGQRDSAGGTGLTTAEMQTSSTFLEADWDFVGETANGTEDIWWIDEGKDYPRLWWELIPEN